MGPEPYTPAHQAGLLPHIVLILIYGSFQWYEGTVRALL